MLCLVFGILFTGCGSSSVNLNDYITVSESGYDGYGSISVDINYNKLIEDHSNKLTNKSLDTSVFGDKTPALAAAFVFSFYKPYALAYEQSETLKNGDKVEFSWNINESAIETLKEILKVNIKYKNFTYKVENLTPLREVDPFANIEYDTSGFSGAGWIGNYPKVVIDDETNGTITWDLKLDRENGKFSNGDSATFKLKSDYDDEYYAKNYGMILTRRSGDVIVNDLKYYPVENPREVFENLREEDIENTKKAIKDHYDYYAGLFSNCKVGEIESEYVGAAYYYNDEIDFSVSNYKNNSKLVLVFHLTNGVEPDGWYVYAELGESVYIKYVEGEDGSLVKRTTSGAKLTEYKEFPDAGGYFMPGVEFLTKSKVRTDFTYNGIRYAGFQTLEECENGFEYHRLTNKGSSENPYKHMVATEKLKDIFIEY